MVADAVGLPLDRLESSGELAAAANDITVAAGKLAAGSVPAQRITVSGIRGDRTLLRFRATWYCTTDFESEWDLKDTGWHISVEGDAPLEVGLHMPIPLEREYKRSERTAALTQWDLGVRVLSKCIALIAQRGI